jgi:hypothetical protein
MARKVSIDKPVLRAIGSSGLSRAGCIVVVSCLLDDLGAHYDRFRMNRHPDDPDLFFVFPFRMLDEETWHAFDFSINDTTTEGWLFVEEVIHRSRPA